MERREGERGGSAVTPVFNVNAIYTPYELLDLHLDGYRNVQPSVSMAGANTVVTGVSAGGNYRFLRRFSASLTGGYEHSEYVQEDGNSGNGRNDNYFFVRGGPQYELNDHCRIGAFYEFRKNDSSRSDRSFQNNQITLEASIAY